ncbi:MAG: hypothetical protein M1343_08300 [Chloroflexi bacterium]|nr:hypothetical protein [Chloroflexota bacterium]
MARRFSMVNLWPVVNYDEKMERTAERNRVSYVLGENDTPVDEKIASCEDAGCRFCDDSELACHENVEQPVSLAQVASCVRWENGTAQRKSVALSEEFQAVVDSLSGAVRDAAKRLEKVASDLYYSEDKLTGVDNLSVDNLSSVVREVSDIGQGLMDSADNVWPSLKLPKASGKETAVSDKQNESSMRLAHPHIATVAAQLRLSGYGQSLINRIVASSSPAFLFRIAECAKTGRRIPEAIIMAQLARQSADQLKNTWEDFKAGRRVASKLQRVSYDTYEQKFDAERGILASNLAYLGRRADDLRRADIASASQFFDDIQKALQDANSSLVGMLEAWQQWDNYERSVPGDEKQTASKKPSKDVRANRYVDDIIGDMMSEPGMKLSLDRYDFDDMADEALKATLGKAGMQGAYELGDNGVERGEATDEDIIADAKKLGVDTEGRSIADIEADVLALLTFDGRVNFHDEFTERVHDVMPDIAYDLRGERKAQKPAGE